MERFAALRCPVRPPNAIAGAMRIVTLALAREDPKNEKRPDSTAAGRNAF